MEPTMKIKLAIISLALTFAVCEAQEPIADWEIAGDQTCCEEEEATPRQCCHHNNDIFFSPHFYDKGYKERQMPAPDWPGFNDNFIEQMTR